MLLDLSPGRLFDALGNHVGNRGGRLGLSRFLCLVLTVALIGLSPLTYASPADPVPIPGFYDDADHDGVVDFLTNMGAVINRPPQGVGRLCIVAGLLPSLSASTPYHAPVLAFHLRPPPTA